jgi:manganese/iron transport system substrate-binding protein
MKPKIAGIIFVLGIWLSGCQLNSTNQTEGKPKVVSTSTIIANLVEEVGGEYIEHKGIIKTGADPHVYEPVPQDTIALEQADLIFYNGYNLEPNLIKLIQATGIQGNKIALGEKIPPLEYESKGQKEPDPHVWGSAENGIIMVKEIRDQLIKINPDNTEEITQNAEELINKLTSLHTWIQEQITTIPEEKRKLVTTHDAFQYYTKAYGLEIIGTLIGISTEEQPSAQTVKQLADTIKASGVSTIFAETTINPVLITTVAEEAGVKLAENKLYSDSLGAKGSEADSYIKMLQFNTKTIVNALRAN